MKLFFLFLIFSPIFAIYEEERALQNHYDRNPNYWSTVGSAKAISSILEQLEVYPVFEGRALDLGCGDGRLSVFLAKYFGMSVDGIDMSSTRIEKGIESAHFLNLTKVSLKVGDIYDFVENTHKRYDLIAAFEVLEHLVDPIRVIKEARKRLKNDGWMIGSVPINFPYEAHLQVFPTVEDALRVFSPDKWIASKERGKDGKQPANIYMRWGEPTKTLFEKIKN